MSSASYTYGWAQPHVVNICRIEPANFEFCFSASAATRHYVSFVMRGHEKRGGTEEAFVNLARVIASQSRREIIKMEWGFDPGKARVLGRFGGRILPRVGYDFLAAILKDPARKQALNSAKKITPQVLQAITQGDPLILKSVGVEPLTRIGGDVMRYVVAGVKSVRPQLTENDISARLRQRELVDVESLALALLSDMGLLPVPWEGTENVRPVRTVKDLKRISGEFRNCLGREDRLLQAIVGKRAYYVCFRKGRPEAVACLAHDEVIQSWRLEELKGSRNKQVTGARRLSIVEDFGAAGYPYIPEERMLGCSL